ncbi:hypothetical protein QWY93_12280 [Echinicola jeungdonensis]|uniref:Uncharacterized protein n=1 Tax=Echinicola jeungdonensis TaxID=709343 RepID=A0ABV5J501_9BACT|nr:hypothetical protein [Echinicola jeungdonensis]MDN3670102.1 hypothetical protein [Echinicola jeungdonensis]
MKNIILSLLLICLISSGYCKNPEEKTFLVIFNKAELKELKSSAKYIELSFLEEFETKSYMGNSDAAIFINVPDCEFDKCQFGQTLVQVNQSTWKPLQEVAFRIIDMDESRENYQGLMSSFYEKIDKKKAKAIRSIL